MSSHVSDADTEMSQQGTPQAPASQLTPEQQQQQLAQLLRAYHDLHDTNQFLLQELESLQCQQAPQTPAQRAPTPQGNTLTIVETVRKLPDFKVPSVKPLTFSGNIKNKPAHQLQNYGDDYLDRSLEIGHLYNFAESVSTVTHIGQPTYVQFTVSGLTEHASIEAMESLNQSKSAILYSAQFNELISAISTASVTYDSKHLCIKYLQGLKIHLRTMLELFRITDNLDKLQLEAEKLDDLIFRH
ncbi:UNVERIFIED_CONTAM: hypothetical protein HDU68_005414, partial [Siphonaria sp. JEL0065]